MRDVDSPFFLWVKTAYLPILVYLSRVRFVLGENGLSAHTFLLIKGSYLSKICAMESYDFEMLTCLVLYIHSKREAGTESDSVFYLSEMPI